ncbi:MAG TPA: hypothetical protein VLC09_20955, partial [Polyangiaceae bacterium]|nr:hypothetical protein [Polyangiaceae bacterium]
GVLLAVGWVVTRGRAGLRTASFAGGGVALFVGAQLAFRYFYYDDWLPNTAYAKVVIHENRLKAGIAYITDSFQPLAAVWCVLLLGLLRAAFVSSGRKQLIPPLLLALGWVGYLMRVGGDNFPAWRHLPYVIGLAAVVLAQLVAEEHERAGRFTGLGYFAVSIVALGWLGTFCDPNNVAGHQRWQWDGRPVSKVLARAFAQERPSIAVDAAGAIPYFSGLPSIDMLGLNDRYLAHHRPEGMGQDLIGHELGDADYYLRRKPDLFCFGVPPCFHGPRYATQQALVKKRGFRDDYIPVRIQTRLGARPLVSEFWLDKTGRLGPKREGGQLSIPAYLFEGNPPLSRLDGEHLISRFERGRAFTRVKLEPGSYRLAAVDARGAARLSVGGPGVQMSADLASPSEFVLEREAVVEFAITATAPIEVRGLVLSRR